MNAIALSPEQFIFAQGEELKTTSLKIAEAFNKKHGDVLRSIDNVLTQVSDSFGERNFAPTDYDQENNLGIPTKYRAYNLTKDGFMFLVMSFTGKQAAAIKEAYINAFNLMHEKLFPVQYGLKQLEAPRAKKAIKGGLLLEQQDQINDLIKERLLNVPQDRRAAMAIRIYSAINTKFDTKGMKDGYKNIAPEHFDNIMLLIARLPLDEKELLTFAPLELSALIRENIERAKVGVLVEAEPAPRPAYSPRLKLLVTIENGETSESLVPFGCGVVDPKDPVNIRTFINECVALDMLPTITNAVFAKLNRHLDREIKKTAALG